MKSAPCSCGLILIIGFGLGCLFMLFIYSSFIIPNKNAHIALLQEQKKTNDEGDKNLKPITKQEIRTFLESIHPEILRRIDHDYAKILTTLSVPNQVKLTNLSERPDFEKYMSFKQINNDTDDFNDFDDPNVFIEGDEYFNWIQAHYLYPKDALKN